MVRKRFAGEAVRSLADRSMRVFHALTASIRRGTVLPFDTTLSRRVTPDPLPSQEHNR